MPHAFAEQSFFSERTLVMAENPYQAPAADTRILGIRSGSVEDLRKVAKYQKGILMCILIQIVGFLAMVFLQSALPSELRLLINLALLVVGLTGTVFVFLLAANVYSTAVGILMAVLTLIPCLGLIMLFIVNGKATAVLRQNGIQVGFLGADLSKI